MAFDFRLGRVVGWAEWLLRLWLILRWRLCG